MLYTQRRPSTSYALYRNLHTESLVFFKMRFPSLEDCSDSVLHCFYYHPEQTIPLFHPRAACSLQFLLQKTILTSGSVHFIPRRQTAYTPGGYSGLILLDANSSALLTVSCKRQLQPSSMQDHIPLVERVPDTT